VDKILEIGQQAGTPIAYLVIAYFAWQMFLIVTKFADRHFKHIDTMENQMQEITKTNSENAKQLTQALSALNQSVATQNQLTTQMIGEIKPLMALMIKLEQVIKHCENRNGRTGE
jgi:hypothetical protein